MKKKRLFARNYVWETVTYLILAAVILHEPFTGKSLLGCILIGAGTLFMVL